MTLTLVFNGGPLDGEVWLAPDAPGVYRVPDTYPPWEPTADRSTAAATLLRQHLYARETGAVDGTAIYEYWGLNR